MSPFLCSLVFSSDSSRRSVEFIEVNLFVISEIHGKTRKAVHNSEGDDLPQLVSMISFAMTVSLLSSLATKQLRIAVTVSSRPGTTQKSTARTTAEARKYS